MCRFQALEFGLFAGKLILYGNVGEHDAVERMAVRPVVAGPGFRKFRAVFRKLELDPSAFNGLHREVLRYESAGNDRYGCRLVGFIKEYAPVLGIVQLIAEQSIAACDKLEFIAFESPFRAVGLDGLDDDGRSQNVVIAAAERDLDLGGIAEVFQAVGSSGGRCCVPRSAGAAFIEPELDVSVILLRCSGIIVGTSGSQRRTCDDATPPPDKTYCEFHNRNRMLLLSIVIYAAVISLC